ncbi:hypothetical protein GCM10010520_52900 [Rhizobium viscosum]
MPFPIGIRSRIWVTGGTRKDRREKHSHRLTAPIRHIEDDAVYILPLARIPIVEML